MNRLTLAAALACAALASSQAGAAGTIQVVSGTRGVTIASNGPVAQTFVATDALLTDFGFQFASSVNGATTGSVTFSLLSGAGTTGPALVSQTTALSGLSFRTGSTFYSVFTGSAGLTAGQTYTALLSGASANVSLLFGPNSGQTADVYAPGFLIKNNSLDQACANNGYCDANFRFTTATAAGAVPETGTWAMLLAGIGAVGTALRRRRGHAATASARA
jgi:hypothetical protein